MNQNPPTVLGRRVPEDAALWRYMDVFRLLDLLQTHQLHMTRADQMEDQWEGARGLFPFDENGAEVHHDSYLAKVALPTLYHFGRESVFMNCWYLGESESYAMWKLYGAEGKGMALKTSVGRLHGAILEDEESEEMWAARVQYSDHPHGPVPGLPEVLSPFLYKRECYAYEKEYRILELRTPEPVMTDGGPELQTGNATHPIFHRIPVDLQTLVSAIYLSPDTRPWVATSIEKMIHGYAPWVDVVVSNLGQRPRY